MAQLSHWESQGDRKKSLRQLDDLVGAGAWKEVMALTSRLRMSAASNAKSQAGFWIRAITAASKVSKIPNFATMLSAAPLIIHGDAAGSVSGGYGALSHLPDGSVP